MWGGGSVCVGGLHARACTTERETERDKMSLKQTGRSRGHDHCLVLTDHQ